MIRVGRLEVLVRKRDAGHRPDLHLHQMDRFQCPNMPLPSSRARSSSDEASRDSIDITPQGFILAPAVAPPWALMSPRRSSLSPLRLSTLLPSGRGGSSCGASRMSILPNILLQMPLSNEAFDLVAERVALLGGVADSPMVLAVLAPIGIGGWGLLPGRGK